MSFREYFVSQIMSSLVLPSLSDVHLPLYHGNMEVTGLLKATKVMRCCWLNCVPPTPQDSVLEILTPGPDKVTFPEKRVSYGIPLQLCKELSEEEVTVGCGGSLLQHDRCPCKQEKCGHRHVPRGMLCVEMKTELKIMLLQAKEG